MSAETKAETRGFSRAPGRREAYVAERRRRCGPAREQDSVSTVSSVKADDCGGRKVAHGETLSQTLRPMSRRLLPRDVIALPREQLPVSRMFGRRIR